MLLFIFFVIFICLGLFILKSENRIFDDWVFILMAVVMIVCGFMGAGVTLFKLAQ